VSAPEVTTADRPEGVGPPAPKVRTRAGKPWYRRHPVRRTLVVTHRWVSLVLGLLLLVVTTSGAIVLYAGDWTKATHGDVYSVTPTKHPVAFDEAVATVAAAHPAYENGSVNVYQGLYQVFAADSDAHPGFWGVDPGTGRITGFVNPDRGFMGLMLNVHECGLTCDTYTGYVPFLDKPVPWVADHVIDSLTWGAFILAITGLMLLFLALTGAVLWWPGVKRWTHGFRVRWRRTRFTRDFDLHQLVGLVAVPFLLMWGLTGASFEIPKLNDWWYAATGGVTPDESLYEFTSHKAPKGTDDIGLDAAVAAVMAKSPGVPVNAYAPSEKGTAGYYTIYLTAHPDPYRHGPYPGQVGFNVDRHDASHLTQIGFIHEKTVSNQIWDNWRYGTLHYGYGVNGWWRIIWFVFGMTPLLLAWTGVSTWLYKRTVSKRKKRAIAARVATGERVDDVDALVPAP
jgi:hypothetical protein